MAAALSDLSARGCRISLNRQSLKLGQRVVLRPDGLEGLAGTVRWVAQDDVGVEFDYPLHPSILEFLCTKHADARQTINLDLAA